MKKTSLVVVIPTYNERGNVTKVVKALRPVFSRIQDQYDSHILFVDDNSPDGTAQEIKKLIKTYPFVHLLSNKRKTGLGHAYKKGFAYAIDKYKARILIQFDCDLQHDERVLPQMLLSIREGADMVLGSRYVRGGSIPEKWPAYRKFLSVAGNLYIRAVMLNFGIRDWTTGYRAIKSDVATKILPTMVNSAFNGYTYQIGFLVKTLQKGYNVREVAFHFRDRLEGESKLGPEYIFNTMRYIMKVRLSQIIGHRIFKFVMVGGTGALIQFVALHFYRRVMPFQLAFFLAIETAIFSNFTWNNLWTFADRKLKPIQIPGKFVQFNLASGGSILIQQAIAFFGETFIGLYTLYTLPGTNYTLDTGAMFAVVGIFVGMFWNFFAYNRIIWKKK